ncbi:MAG: hypothetical protein HQL87_07020 [Magnetococcales bacterium]|nr:hypothetical protein [Magnetococcales bacterium]
MSAPSQGTESVRALRTNEKYAQMTPRSLYQSVAQFHENPQLLAFSITPKGNLVLWATVLVVLGLTPYLSPVPLPYLPLFPLLILAQQFPARRIEMMGFGVGGLFLFHRLVQLHVTHLFWFVLDAALVVGMLYIFFTIAQSFARLPRLVRNNPQIFLHLLLWCGILVLAGLPAGFREDPSWVIASNLSVCCLFFAFLIWRIGFMLYSGKRGSIQKTGFVDHLIYCLPYLGSTQVPYGKGLDYLLPKLAESRLDLAKAQLAGVKLLLLAYLWRIILLVLDVAFFGTFGTHGQIVDVPSPLCLRLYHIDGLIDLSTQHMPTMAIVWASLIVDMVYETMQLAIIGHVIIGCLRLFGFNVFRNTYKPLLSTSLINFWNRYYYYFKELLVDFFFFPTYLSFFKHRPRLRIFAATMASAFLGNFYYHLLQHFDGFIESGEALSFVKFYSYFFYSFVLGIGIFISILREQNQRGKPVVASSPGRTFWVTLRKIAGVWLFFSMLRIWDHPGSAFMQDTTFFFAIWGIHF